MYVALIAALSADGKIGTDEYRSSTEWTSPEDTAFFVRKSRDLGTVIMGRKTFDTIGKPLDARLTVVMTRSPGSHEQQPGLLEFTDAPPSEILRDLESRGRSRVALSGGYSVYSRFLADGLVNELFLTVEPILFGRGIPLAENFERINMTLIDSKRLGAQTVLLHYRVK